MWQSCCMNVVSKICLYNYVYVIMFMFMQKLDYGHLALYTWKYTFTQNKKIQSPPTTNNKPHYCIYQFLTNQVTSHSYTNIKTWSSWFENMLKTIILNISCIAAEATLYINYLFITKLFFLQAYVYCIQHSTE